MGSYEKLHSKKDSLLKKQRKLEDKIGVEYQREYRRDELNDLKNKLSFKEYYNNYLIDESNENEKLTLTGSRIMARSLNEVFGSKRKETALGRTGSFFKFLGGAIVSVVYPIPLYSLGVSVAIHSAMATISLVTSTYSKIKLNSLNRGEEKIKKIDEEVNKVWEQIESHQNHPYYDYNQHKSKSDKLKTTEQKTEENVESFKKKKLFSKKIELTQVANEPQSKESDSGKEL